MTSFSVSEAKLKQNKTTYLGLGFSRALHYVASMKSNGSSWMLKVKENK